MAKKQRIEVLSQEERNELGEAMKLGMAKQEVEVWNSAIVAFIHEIEQQGKPDELVLVSGVIAVAQSMLKAEIEEGGHG